MESMTAVAAPPLPPVEANENTEYTTHTEETDVAAVEEETCTPYVAQNDEEVKAEENENVDGSNVENGEQKEEEEAAAEQQQEASAAAVNEETVSTPEQKPSPASPLVHLNSVVPPPAAAIHVASPDRLHRRKVNGSLMSDPTNTGDIHKDNTNGVSNTNTHRHGVAVARSAAALRRSQGSNHKPSTTDKNTTHATAAVEVDAEGVPVAPATIAQLPSSTTTHTVTQHTEQTTTTTAPQHEDENDVAAHKAKHISTTTGQKKAHATHHTTKKPVSNAAASSSSLPSSQLKHTPTTTADTQRKSGATNTTPLASRRRHLVPPHPTSLSTRGAAHQKTHRPTSYETSNNLSHTTQMSDEAYMQDMMKKYHGPATTTVTRRPAVGRKVHKQPRTEPQEKTETSIHTAHNNNNEKTIHHTATGKTTSEPTRRACQRRLRFDDDGLCALRQQLQRMLGPVRPAAMLAANQSNGRHATTKSASRTRVRNASPTMAQDEATQNALAALPFNTVNEAADAVPALPRALEMSLVTLYEEALTQLTPSVRDQLVLRLSPPASRAIVLDCVKRRLARLQPTPLRRYNSSVPVAMSERNVNGGRKATSMPGSPYARRAGAPASAPREERSGIYDESALAAEAVTRPSEPLLGGYRQPSRHSQRRHLRPNTTTDTHPTTTATGPLEEFRTAFATEVRAMFIEDCALACLRAHQRHERRQNTTMQPSQKEDANESQQKDINEDDEQREATLRECYSRAVQAYLHRLLGTQAGQSETSYVEGLVTMLYPWLNSEISAQAEQQEETSATQDQDNTHTGMVDYFILLVTEGDAAERSELPVTECGGEGQQNTSEDVTQGESNEVNALEPEVSAPAQPVLVQ